MNIETLTSTLDAAGTIMIAYMALRVHHRVAEEHKIDTAVFSAMKKEQLIGFAGIVCILAGYFLDLIS